MAWLEEYKHLMESLSLWGLRLFLVLVAGFSLRHASTLFFQRHGWLHRVAGGALLAWLLLGAATIPYTPQRHFCLCYDVILGVLGIVVTLTAAHDFPHVHVKNAKGQSGTLAERAIVTQSEMLEHSFYQGLNLCQALYLHAMTSYGNEFSKSLRLLALLGVTLPWWFRQRFPVHSFSNNWKQSTPEKSNTTELLLYRIKKCQYLFYKHAVLHGVNISVALSFPKNDLPISWRIFWLALNVSYVMEFFLQSMVKRKTLAQSHMLLLQRLLMTASSLAAVVAVVPIVRLDVVCASLLLNIIHRHHDVANTMFIAAVAMLQEYQQQAL